jgi:hypothetical protein
MEEDFAYKNGPVEDNGVKMSRVPLNVNYAPRMMEELLNGYKNFRTGKCAADFPWATRFVMGFPLPSWQRDFVWTLHQQVQFIITVWSKGDLGYYIVNDWQMSDGKTFDKHSSVLLDGQQRLTTIERYITDQFAVPDVTGVARLWSEVPRREQMRFISSVFTRGSVNTFDEQELRTIYDLRNFAGTPHKESERALTQN